MKQAKRNRYQRSILLALLVLLLPARADGANGELDPGCTSEDGHLLVDIGFDNDIGHAVAVQPDGKIVVAGSADDDVVLVRTRPQRGARQRLRQRQRNREDRFRIE